MHRRRLHYLLFACTILFCLGARADTWNQVRSAHFVLNTDAGSDRGRQVLLRFEQMRALFGQLILRSEVNVPVPLTIIAFRNSDEMQAHVPVYEGKAVDLSGFFVSRPDRDYVVLDLSAGNAWTTVFHEYAHVLLDGNYPATPLWFDEGFADYFSTIEVLREGVQIGKAPQGYLEKLRSSKWIPFADVLQVQPDSKTYNLSDRRSLYYAESWVLVHYLFDMQKMPAAGEYFGLVEGQRVPVEQAVHQAFGLNSQQLELQVKKYYLSPQAVYRTVKLPVDVTMANTYSSDKIPAADAQAMLAGLDVHMDAHQQHGMQALQELLQQHPDNAMALRDLGYAYLQKDDLDNAADCFEQAAKLNSADAWVHYYSAVLRHRSGEKLSPEELEATKSDLKDAIRLNPQFADAHNLLGLAEMESGDLQLCIRSLTTAVQLSPRNESYRANLAQAYIFARKWDDATALLQSLATSKDPKIAEQANQQMQEMDQARTRERVEILGRPADDYTAPQWRPKKTAPHPEDTGKAAEQPQLPTHGPIHYLKGTLLSVNCATAPAATLSVRAGGKTWKILTADYQKMALIGADQFSCQWHDRKVALNYRAMGIREGALVSLELQ
ncbi:MAG TPA: tetratricopeptide repeat protein [Terriglobales bacterium]|nr:tetratricopeptide repeat protein [Terriglobales bacterium]